MTSRQDWPKPDLLQQRRLELGLSADPAAVPPLPSLLLKPVEFEFARLLLIIEMSVVAILMALRIVAIITLPRRFGLRSSFQNSYQPCQSDENFLP